MTATSPRRSVRSRLVAAFLGAFLGGFIGDRLEPTWHAVVNGERYRYGGKLPKSMNAQWVRTAVQSPPLTRRESDPGWALGGAAVGAALGLVGGHWQFRGRAVASVVGGLLGSVVGGLYAFSTDSSLYRGRDPASGIKSAAVVGGAFGAAIGLHLGRRPAPPATIPPCPPPPSTAATP